ncbi:MAG: hypothetical protein QOI74_975 [Micromonosporaceae bacterium]|jgi:hypothetical protein|nr:hypothetical protein [Micromonosporaceae bacterium]MDT5037040.1 hypothetical protein [Micromonosporaceae bacterium]
MGRGRAKAKQTRVARELKYHSPNTDLAALQRELAGSSRDSPGDLVDDYGEYVDEDDDEDDRGGSSPPGRR